MAESISTYEQERRQKRDKLREQWAEYQALSPREREDIASEPRRKK